MNIAAYFYNNNIQTHSGTMEAVLNIKQVPDRLARSVVADYERGLTGGIMKYPWQSETCRGDWHYDRSLYERPGEYGGYLPPRDVIHWLIDTVSKNGTFILNIPGRPDGTIDSKETAVLDGITSWMQVSSEAIFDTRPWKVFGEGPNVVKAGSFQGNSVSKLGPTDIRFTRNKANNVVYALTLGCPREAVVVKSLGLAASTQPGKVAKVDLFGSNERLIWKQHSDALRIEVPRSFYPKDDYAIAFKVTLG